MEYSSTVMDKKHFFTENHQWGEEGGYTNNYKDTKYRKKKILFWKKKTKEWKGELGVQL
jgi:hypothetical protein